MKLRALLITLLYSALTCAQDLSMGLSVVNDTGNYPQQAKAKPAYLDIIIDPSFGTPIRRITDAGMGGVIVPLHSSIQPWNADESLLIVYNQSIGYHQLLHGQHYYFIKNLDDIDPDDIEEIFWDFDEPDILYYLEDVTDNFIRYNVVTQVKEVLVNLDDIVTDCTGAISMGNAIEMMSWDSDVLGFRCNNEGAYSYRISTGELTEFAIDDIYWEAPMPAPSGDLFYHRGKVYDASGNLLHTLNENPGENGSFGKLPNGDDAHFTVTFSSSPNGGCEGNIVAHNMVTGECFEVISEAGGYPYSQSGTQISALAHKNTEGGWIAASIMGYDEDGQSLLDQEIVLVKAEAGNNTVCRIAHHRSDRDEFDPWGAARATISPSGTRVLFASDWSGAEDGQSVDCYVVELPVYESPIAQSGPPVYPGDCNMDGQVSADDAIYINLALGSTLPIRPNASTDWTPQAAYDSGDSIQGIDLKYIDTDGNGLIDSLDLAVITQNFGNTHLDSIPTNINTIMTSPVSYDYDSTVVGEIIMHQYTYHFEEITNFPPPYGTSLVFDYSEFEAIIGIELDIQSLSTDIKALYTYNDVLNKKFHVAISQLVDKYDMKIVVCEDAASLTSSDDKSNNTPSLILKKQIIIDENGEKFEVTYETLNITNPTLHNIQAFPNPIKSGNPISLHSEKPMEVQLQFMDSQGCIYYQSVESLQNGKNTIHGLATNLAKGVYFIKITDANNNFYTYKIIII